MGANPDDPNTRQEPANDEPRYATRASQNRNRPLDINSSSNSSSVEKNQSKGGEFCQICNIWLTSRVVASQHYAGQRHMRETKKNNNNNRSEKNHDPTDTNATNQTKPIFNFTYDPKMAPYLSICFSTQVRCELCSVVGANNMTFELHLNGKKHMKLFEETVGVNRTNEMIAAPPVESIPSNVIADTQEPPIKSEPKELLRCDICNITLPNELSKRSHLAGKRHIKTFCSMTGAPNPKLKEDDDKKFAHLAIAWHKYEIPYELKLKTSHVFDFYCSLCDKYIQRKLQLIDHLKSSKHHNKIYELRAKQKQEDQSTTSFIPSRPVPIALLKRRNSQNSIGPDSKRVKSEPCDQQERDQKASSHHNNYSTNIYAAYHQSNKQI